MTTEVRVRCDNPACGVTDTADKQATYDAGWVEARIWSRSTRSARGMTFGIEYHFHAWTCFREWVNNV